MIQTHVTNEYGEPAHTLHLTAAVALSHVNKPARNRTKGTS